MLFDCLSLCVCVCCDLWMPRWIISIIFNLDLYFLLVATVLIESDHCGVTPLPHSAVSAALCNNPQTRPLNSYLMLCSVALRCNF